MFDEKVFDPRPKSKLKVLNVLPPNPEEGPEERKGRFPSWLHRRLPQGKGGMQTRQILSKYKLNTVCEEAKCPNRTECYSKKTATFLALGKECTRSCGFCDIDFSKTPKEPEADEPERIAFSVKDLGLKHVVITMVARDDLKDGGALHIATIIDAIRQENPSCSIEVLTSDFSGNFDALDTILRVKPDVFNHNIETVRALSPKVRHKATYDRTLSVLAYVQKSGLGMMVKSGIMVGLGESPKQVKETIEDLARAGCDIITIGQYLQADRRRLGVKAFIPPSLFKEYEEYGYAKGVKQMYCGPFVRSSYNALEVSLKATKST